MLILIMMIKTNNSIHNVQELHTFSESFKVPL